MDAIKVAEKLDKKGDYFGSLELALKVLEKEPNNLRAMELKASLCGITGKNSEAIRAYKELLRFYESNGKVWAQFYALNSISSLYSRLKKYEKQMSYCEKSIELCERFSKIDGPQKEDFEEELIGILWTLGECQRKSRSYFDAIDTYKKLLRLLSKSGGLVAIADALFELASAYYKANRTTEALSKYSKALNIYKILERPPSFFYNRPISHYYVGSIYFTARDFKKALFHAERCVFLLDVIYERHVDMDLKADSFYRKAKRLQNSLEKNRLLWKKHR